jgi:CheY-like chemotaxis protein
MERVSIFLVEDETLIRMMLLDMLEELGHRVVAEAASLQKAEPLAHSCAFDLGIFDINIAGLDISPVADIVASRGLPFLFVSGYGAAGLPALFKERPVLRKPFLISELQAMINSLLTSVPKPSPG